MTKRLRSRIAIGLSIILLFLIGVLFLTYQFLGAFALPEIKITRDYIATSDDFINGVAIEKLAVDSIGEKGYPVRYTTLYTTTCNVRPPQNKPPNPPQKIEFYKPGKYSWNEDTGKIKYIHDELSRHALQSSDSWWLYRVGDYPICPMKIEDTQWYFFTFSDPQVTGIFFYIDKSGKEHQYFIPSGISPI